MGHLQQRCMSDSDDDEEDATEGGSAMAPQFRNFYRKKGAAGMKLKWSLRSSAAPPPPAKQAAAATTPPSPPSAGFLSSLRSKKGKKKG